MTATDIKTFFNGLTQDTLHLVDGFYDAQAHFKDPMVEFHDRSALKAYYANLYQHVTQITFEFTGEISQGAAHTVMWTMRMTAPGFNGGQPVVLDGVSHIVFGGAEGKAVYHRDYFDMGAFVYERLPVLKNIIGLVKKKMSAAHG